MLSKLLVLCQMFLVALAAPTLPHDAELPDANTLPHDGKLFHDALPLEYASPEEYVQKLLNSELTGEALLNQYDAHYDNLPREDKLEEKKSYPEEVYQYLLEHRKNRHVN